MPGNCRADSLCRCRGCKPPAAEIERKRARLEIAALSFLLILALIIGAAAPLFTA